MVLKVLTARFSWFLSLDLGWIQSGHLFVFQFRPTPWFWEDWAQTHSTSLWSKPWMRMVQVPQAQSMAFGLWVSVLVAWLHTIKSGVENVKKSNAANGTVSVNSFNFGVLSVVTSESRLNSFAMPYCHHYQAFPCLNWVVGRRLIILGYCGSITSLFILDCFWTLI